MSRDAGLLIIQLENAFGEFEGCVCEFSFSWNLTVSAILQPSFVALLLFPAEQSHATNGVNDGASSAQSGESGPSSGDDTNGILDVLWKMLLKSAELVKRLADHFLMLIFFVPSPLEFNFHT